MFKRKTKAAPDVPVTPASKELVPMSPAAARAHEIRAALEEARSDLAAAEAGLAATRQEHEAALDRASIDDALAAQPRIAEAATLVEIARRLVERLDAEHAEACQGARSAAEFAEREHLRITAEETAREYERLFRELMPEAAADVHTVLRAWAVAQMAHEAAADKGITLPAIEAFRHLVGRPRENFGHEFRDLWINPHSGEPFDAERQRRIKLQGDGTGLLSSPNGATIARQKRRFRETTYRPAVPTRVAPVLAKELSIPALFAGQRAGYVPPDQYAFSAKAVLDALDVAENAQATLPVDPPLKVERKPIELARDVQGEGVVRREPPVAKLTRNITSFS